MADDLTRLRDWQVKDFPEDLRKAVVVAAKAAEQSVAEWLEPVVRAALGEPVNRLTSPVNLGEVAEACCRVAATEEASDAAKKIADRLLRQQMRALLQPRVTRKVNSVNRPAITAGSAPPPPEP